jgi:hypothetical protein
MTTTLALKAKINPHCTHLTNRARRYYRAIKRRTEFTVTAIVCICILSALNSVSLDTIIPNPFGLIISIIFSFIIEMVGYCIHRCSTINERHMIIFVYFFIMIGLPIVIYLLIFLSYIM